MAALERRHGREAFALVDIVSAVLADTGHYAESTIRTHITSLMCVNASAHHGTRYPDLERVDRGMYCSVHR